MLDAERQDDAVVVGAQRLGAVAIVANRSIARAARRVERSRLDPHREVRARRRSSAASSKPVDLAADDQHRRCSRARRRWPPSRARTYSGRHDALLSTPETGRADVVVDAALDELSGRSRHSSADPSYRCGDRQRRCAAEHGATVENRLLRLHRSHGDGSRRRRRRPAVDDRSTNGDGESSTQVDGRR